MNKHAFLILAHADFEVLQYLVTLLDHTRNDIFIHFDKKVKAIPSLKLNHAQLHILEDRVDISWGDISMLKAEFALFSAAKKFGPFQHYHVLSGSHLPLQTMAEIHRFFDQKVGFSILQKLVGSPYEFDLKLRRFHFFSRYINLTSRPHQKLGNILWRFSLRLQRFLQIRRNLGYNYVKASQWLSLSPDALDLLLSKQRSILKTYRYTLCPDEFFVATALSNSALKNFVYYEENYLQQDFSEGTNPKTYTMKDLPELLKSTCLFARKFGSIDLQVAHLLAQHVIDNESIDK